MVFTAGGSATGKSSILRKASKKKGVAFIVDTTFSNTERAIDQVDRALQAGYKVEIHYVYRDFKASVVGMVERALDPSSGRIVPIDDMARTHFGAQRALLEALQRYSENPNVSVTMTKNTSKGILRMDEAEFAGRLFSSIDALRKIGQLTLDELQDSQRPKGTQVGAHHHSRGEGLRISKDFYEAARSKAEKGDGRAKQGDA